MFDAIIEYFDTRAKDVVPTLRLIRLINTSYKMNRYFEYEMKRRFPKVKRPLEIVESEVEQEVEKVEEVHYL
jgi:hypothetical protein